MAFRVFDDSISGGLFVILIVFGTFTIVVTAVRFLAARKLKRKPSLEDWLALSSEIVYLAFTGASLATLCRVNGRNMATLVYIDPTEFAFIRERSYAIDQLFPVQQLLGKLSILALYRRIFGINRTYVAWIYFLAAAQMVESIVMLFVQVFQCKPVAYFWMPWTEGTCMSAAKEMVGVELPNTLIDFAMVALAMVMVRTLQMPSSTIWRLRGLFGMGGLAGICGGIKMGVSFASLEGSTYETLGTWGCLQMALLVICCSAPVLGPFLPRDGFWSRLTSGFSFSRKSRSGRSGRRGDASNDSLERHASKSGASDRSQPWVYLADEGNSSRGLAWAAGPTPGTPAAPGPTMLDHAAYPLKSIQVERTVDVV